MIVTEITTRSMSLPGLRDVADMRERVRAAVDADTAPLWMWLPPNKIIVCAVLSATWEDIPGAVSAHSYRLEELAEGARVRWHTVVAPRKNVIRPGAKSAKVPMPKGGVAPWLVGRLEGCLASVSVDSQQVWHTGGGPVSWALSGRGVVADGSALVALIGRGVGPGKQLGNGLLVVEAERG